MRRSRNPQRRWRTICRVAGVCACLLAFAGTLAAAGATVQMAAAAPAAATAPAPPAAPAPAAAAPTAPPPFTTAPSGTDRPLMPDPALEPPQGFVPILTVYGRGIQRYACRESGKGAGAFAWTLVEPQAQLFDGEDHEVGKHSAGPTWQLTDGSRAVKKKLVATFPALQSDGIPWLLLEIESSGEGRLAGARYVQRIDTVGGAAPLAGCDAAHSSATHDVEYRATYIFYGQRARK